MTTESTHPLCTEILHWHEIIQLRYKQFLECLTALELIRAEENLRTFSLLLNNNLNYMKGQIDSLQEGDADTLRIIAADHLILRRTLIKIEEALNVLEQAAKDTPISLRSLMVDRLDIFIRLMNILTHHYARVEDVVIPAIQSSVSDKNGEELAKELASAMKRGDIELH